MPHFSSNTIAANFRPRFPARLLRALRALWRALREWSGDAAYERYLSAFRAAPGEQGTPLSPAEFYLEQLERRYSRPTRCC